jgi:hypothetical protein
MYKDTAKAERQAVRRQWSWQIAHDCGRYLSPLLRELDCKLDRRLVMTLLGLVLGILTHRHRNGGLVLSELGAYLTTPEEASAGTKRIARLLHSEHWSGALIRAFLWKQADERITQAIQEEGHGLVLWDESAQEKPESLELAGLCAVKSLKAARLKRIKKGYYNPPTGQPVCVPGMHWLSVMACGMKGAARVASMQWWTTRGETSLQQRDVEQATLKEVISHWGTQVVHLFDRGYAGAPWLQVLCEQGVRFVMRWQMHYKLVALDGQVLPASQMAARKRCVDYRIMRDARRRQPIKVGVAFLPVRDPDPDHSQPLTLVIARSQGRKPWYLLTNEPVLSIEHAWHIVRMYARRWQIEMAFRFFKSELACESPRLVAIVAREKLLLIAALVYTFLITLLRLYPLDWIYQILSRWCSKPFKRSRQFAAPLYRLRTAIARLFVLAPPGLLNA